MSTDYKVWIAIEKHTVDAGGHESWDDVDCGAPSIDCETLAQARKVADHMAEQGEHEQQRIVNKAAARKRRKIMREIENDRANARKRQRNG